MCREPHPSFIIPHSSFLILIPHTSFCAVNPVFYMYRMYRNQAWFRYLLGWLLPPQMSFLKSSHTESTREASVRKQCYQDVAFPARCFPEAVRTTLIESYTEHHLKPLY